MFDAFISYNHAADGKLAPSLQAGLQQLAKPLFKLRALNVFRDKTGLPLTPILWPQIESSLSESRYFILLASPEAAQSEWVRKEIGFWLANKDIGHFLIAWTGGELAWDRDAGDFDWKVTDALPDALLREKFPVEPLFADLRPFKSEDSLTLKYADFAQEVATIAAPLRGEIPGDLLSEEVRQQRRVRAVTTGAVVALILLTLIAMWQALLATHERARAEQQARVAVAQRMSADAELTRSRDPARLQESLLLASESMHRLGSFGVPYSGSYETLRLGSRLLSASVSAEIASFEGVSEAVFSADGHWFAAYGGAGFAVWDATTWNRMLTPRLAGPVKGLAFSQGDRTAAAWGDNEYLILDLGSSTSSEIVKSSQRILKIAYSCLDKDWLLVGDDGMVRRLEGDGTQSGRRLAKKIFAWPEPMFDECGKHLAYFGDGFAARVYNTQLSRHVAEPELINRPHIIALSGAGQRMALASADQTMGGPMNPTLQLWDVEDNVELGRADLGGWVGAIAFSPRGNRLAVADGPVVRVLNTTDASEIGRAVHRGNVEFLRFSKEGRWLASVDETTARVWDVETVKEVSSVVLPKISSVAFWRSLVPSFAAEHRGWHIDPDQNNS